MSVILPKSQHLDTLVRSISLEEKQSRAKMRWREAFEKAKQIGKGSLHEGALMLSVDYWPEALGLPAKVFGLESSDKLLHLRPKEYYAEHFTAWKATETQNISFAEYFAKKVAAEKIENVKTVEYKTKADLKKVAVYFQDGKPMQQGKALEDGKYTFVLSADGKTLYAEKKVKRVKDELRHSSFTAGACVQSAGKFIVKDGKITEIVPNDSGHYKPTQEHGEYVLEFLRNKNHLGEQATREIKVNLFEAPQ
jgi:hypothetical protein